MEWLIGSDEMQQLTIDRFGVPIRAGMKPRQGVLGLDDMSTMLRPTPQEAVTGVPEVIELWRDAFGV